MRELEMRLPPAGPIRTARTAPLFLWRRLGFLAFGFIATRQLAYVARDQRLFGQRKLTTAGQVNVGRILPPVAPARLEY